jgi:hypothetical protein
LARIRAELAAIRALLAAEKRPRRRVNGHAEANAHADALIS